jgi:hypothetical protein
VKHNLICDKNKTVLYLSKAYNGTTHDKKLADQEDLKFPIGGLVELFQDTGFQGYNPENVIVVQPTKKTKGKELTQEQKDKNKEISSKRVLVEHAIGGVKILRIIKDEIRIYSENVRNIVMKIACAIHNLKVKRV